MKSNFLSNTIIFIFISILCNSLYSLIFTDFFKKNNSYRNSSAISNLSIQEEDDFQLMTTWNVSWCDYDADCYNGQTSVRDIDFAMSRSNREKVWEEADDWSSFYADIYKHDFYKLDGVHPLFSNIYQKYSFNNQQFVDMVVSFVQTIDYSIPDVAGGLFAPVEFMMHYHGDCDTRTLFLFCILSGFGFDVAILGSDKYKHSMLGVNLPSSGSYKEYLGKRYYFWETTAETYRLGMLPPEWSDTRYWDIELY